MIEQVLKSKFLGALVGTGLGDALGAPFEGRRQVKLEEIEALAERREVLTYTDDTHMMIGVAESLIRARVDIELGNGIEAFNSVPTAIYSFLAHSDSFAQAILYAISLGGDTDTIAAMTGAISGAYLGFESIPGSWRNKLENRLYIEELAHKLWIGFIRGLDNQ